MTNYPIFDKLNLQNKCSGDDMFKTFQTKINNQQVQLFNESSIPLYEYFNSYAQRFGVMERKLFVDLYIHKKPSNSLKTLYCSKYHLTSRQYNSIKKQLDGRVTRSRVDVTLYRRHTNKNRKNEICHREKNRTKRKTPSSTFKYE